MHKFHGNVQELRSDSATASSCCSTWADSPWTLCVCRWILDRVNRSISLWDTTIAWVTNEQCPTKRFAYNKHVSMGFGLSRLSRICSYTSDPAGDLCVFLHYTLQFLFHQSAEAKMCLLSVVFCFLNLEIYKIKKAISRDSFEITIRKMCLSTLVLNTHIIYFYCVSQ